jgi:hypothetical protein
VLGLVDGAPGGETARGSRSRATTPRRFDRVPGDLVRNVVDLLSFIARAGLGEARSSRDVRVSPYDSCTSPGQCVGELPSVVKRPAIEARARERLHRRAKALQSRQLECELSAAASRTCTVLALHARVTDCNNSAATRERFAATDSETSAAAEQAADATTTTSGAQQVRTPPPTEATTHKSNRSEERFSLTRRSRIRSTKAGEINLLLNLERFTQIQTRAPSRAPAATLKHVGSR